MEWILAIINVIFIDIVLSGDNAVVIALATRRLPLHLQRKATLWGSGGAAAMRILLSFATIWLLKIPYLQLAGGLLLVWIALKLLSPEEGTGNVQEAGNLWGAIKTILISDFIMSLDNVVAVTAAANENILVVAFGVALSVPLMIFGSRMISLFMERYSVVQYAGAGIIAWAAGEMIEGERMLQPFVEPWGEFAYVIPFTVTLFVLLVGWILARRGQAQQPDPVDQERHIGI